MVFAWGVKKVAAVAGLEEIELTNSQEMHLEIWMIRKMEDSKIDFDQSVDAEMAALS
jgi:hypothetical protein